MVNKMRDKEQDSWDWCGKQFKVKVLYSHAGVATQILVELIGLEQYILLDIGDGTVRDLVERSKKTYERLNYILLSHGHFDHIGGLFSLLSFFRMIGRREDLTIVAPTGVIELEELVKAFHYCYQDTLTYKIKVVEIKDEKKIGEVKIIPFPVQHKGSLINGQELPRVPSLGYILQKNQERIGYTGDTGYFNDLKSHIKDLDFLLIEGTYKEKKSSYHLSVDEAKKLGKLAKKYLIVHTLPKIIS
ncbi:MAG: MBL fold metallo-hydrolase [Candidatus Heimdallarchaeaceae archaeon]